MMTKHVSIQPDGHGYPELDEFVPDDPEALVNWALDIAIATVSLRYNGPKDFVPDVRAIAHGLIETRKALIDQLEREANPGDPEVS